jgi:hypothetical protein
MVRAAQAARPQPRPVDPRQAIQDEIDAFHAMRANMGLDQYSRRAQMAALQRLVAERVRRQRSGGR